MQHSTAGAWVASKLSDCLALLDARGTAHQPPGSPLRRKATGGCSQGWNARAARRVGSCRVREARGVTQLRLTPQRNGGVSRTTSQQSTRAPPPHRLALNRRIPVQFPPIFQAIARVAVVAAPIVGRALVDAYRQGMISAAPPLASPPPPSPAVLSVAHLAGWWVDRDVACTGGSSSAGRRM